MVTVKVTRPGEADRTFQIESKRSMERAFAEIRRLVPNGERPAEKQARKPLESEAVRAAREYLDSLKGRKESEEATRIAADIRKDWIRKNV